MSSLTFCKKVEIKKETIIAYNPQQNGVAEKKNKTIMEVAKDMLQTLWSMLKTGPLIKPWVTRPPKSLHMCEARCWTLKDLWLPHMLSYAKGKKEQAGSFREERYVCWIL